jgi:4a-hydroxytetrahydrobiopterin dehydratase
MAARRAAGASGKEAMARLSDDEINERLASLAGWERLGDALCRQLSFGTFAEAMAFVNRVAATAEELDHHPDILIEYKTVTLTLSSHDVGGISERDFRLARGIEA